MDTKKTGKTKKGAPCGSPEAEANRRRHQFGQPEANPMGHHMVAVNQREFYRWVESQATEAELRAYLEDDTKPFMRKRFIEAYMNAEEVQDYVAVTNQVHGAPKQTLEVNEMPTIECKVFGEDAKPKRAKKTK